MVTLIENFEQGAANQVVTTANTGFTGIDWDTGVTDPANSDAMFTTQYAHTGTKSITAKTAGLYEELQVYYTADPITQTGEDFFFWARAEAGANGQTVYQMWAGPSGAIRNDGYDYRLGSIYAGGWSTPAPNPATHDMWWMEVEDAEFQTSGNATQVACAIPKGTWVKVHAKVTMTGTVTFTLSNDSDTIYGELVSATNMASRYSTPQYFAFHNLYVSQDATYGKVWIDDINVAGLAETGIINPAKLLYAETKTSTSLTLTWSPPSTGDEPTSYEVELVGGGGSMVISTTQNGTTFADLLPETPYYVRIRSVRGTTKSAWSNSLKLITDPKKLLAMTWNAPSERFFEAGLDRGVLYPKVKPAVAWNGLVSVDEEGGDGAAAYYVDGRPFLFLPRPKEYKATLSAYTFPDEFSEIMGVTEATDGMYLDSQVGSSFDLSYRTKVGNDTRGIEHAYKIHLVYNATVTPQSNSYESISDSINPTTFSWEIQAVPVKVEGFRPTAHIIIDTRHMAQEKIDALEELLYGSKTVAARLPEPQIIFDLLSFGDVIIVTDLGDGTFSVEGSYENVYMLEDGIFRVDNVDAVNHGDGTFTISSTYA